MSDCFSTMLHLTILMIGKYLNTKNLLLNDNPINSDVIFIHFDELDVIGHAHGFSGDVQEYVWIKPLN